MDFSNKECKGLVAVAAKYSDSIENLLNAYYAKNVEIKKCTKEKLIYSLKKAVEFLMKGV